MEGFDPTIMVMLTMLLVPVVGVFMAVTPYLMRRGEVFTVTVPTSEQKDPYVKGLKRRYVVVVLVPTVLLTVAGIACAAVGSYGGAFAVMIVGVLALTGGGYALMLFYRRKMNEYKKERGGWPTCRNPWPWWASSRCRTPSRSSGTCCTCRSWRSR